MAVLEGWESDLRQQQEGLEILFLLSISHSTWSQVPLTHCTKVHAHGSVTNKNLPSGSAHKMEKGNLFQRMKYDSVHWHVHMRWAILSMCQRFAVNCIYKSYTGASIEKTTLYIIGVSLNCVSKAMLIAFGNKKGGKREKKKERNTDSIWNVAWQEYIMRLIPLVWYSSCSQIFVVLVSYELIIDTTLHTCIPVFTHQVFIL